MDTSFVQIAGRRRRERRLLVRNAGQMKIPDGQRIQCMTGLAYQKQNHLFCALQGLYSKRDIFLASWLLLLYWPFCGFI